MKYFMIRYRFQNGTREQWHGEMARFIAALQAEPSLKDRISYRCMKAKQGDDYFHLAVTADDGAANDLQGHAWFKHYSEQTKQISGGTVEVVPLEVVAETGLRL